jgi:hypothetical protein
VFVYEDGTFTMSGGKISGNTSDYGGGVYMSGGTFTMRGGEISGNIVSASSYGEGGGVYVSGGTFTMSGGTISGNTVVSYGGGVSVSGSGTFTMNGGEISGNTSSYSGGGVSVLNGTFTMSGGEISGNIVSASSYGEGGGVYVHYDGTFTKQSGGTIYGSDAEDALKNTADSGDDYGHAVYVWAGSKKRNSTAGVGVTLDSRVDGSAGGWE